MPAAPAPLETTIAPATVSAPAPLSADTPAPQPPQPAADPAPAAVLTAFQAATTASDADLRLAQEMGLIDETPAAEAPATPEETLAPEIVAEAPVAEAEPAPEAPSELEQLRARLAELEAKFSDKGNGEPAATATAPPAPDLPAMAPTAEQPLVNLRSETAIATSEQAARRLKAWAIQHRDGGTVPVELAQLVENAEAARLARAPRQIAQPVEITPEIAASIEASSEEMLTAHLPARRSFLAAERAALDLVRQETPAFLDIKKPEGQLVQRFAAKFPQLTQDPDWPLAVRDMVTGYLANSKKTEDRGHRTETGGKPRASAPEVATGKIIPIAPAAPIGHSAPGGIPVSEARMKQMQERARSGKASDDDWLALSAAAV